MMCRLSCVLLLSVLFLAVSCSVAAFAPAGTVCCCLLFLGVCCCVWLSAVVFWWRAFSLVPCLAALPAALCCGFA